VTTQGENATAAGICLACSYKCHEGHDLVELYTKRNFRCDCGNSKFEQKCQLEPVSFKIDLIFRGENYFFRRKKVSTTKIATTRISRVSTAPVPDPILTLKTVLRMK